MLTIGILREGKIPPDARSPLSPAQCAEAQDRFGVKIVVQPSEKRAYRDEEFREKGIALQPDLSHCDLLLGVKEVPVAELLPGKTYLFFSHTIKKQAYNRRLLQTVLERRVRLIDYEVLTNETGDRLVAFGFYAGVVGAHNAVWAYGKRTGQFELPRMCECHDYAEVKATYARTHFPPMRIVLTGAGRVASGAVHNLHDMGIHMVAPSDFLHKTFDRPVFTQLHASDYVAHRAGARIFDKKHFYQHGDEYVGTFAPYTRRADIFLNGIFYDKKAPMFFHPDDLRRSDWRIQTIGDITCDIAPDSSVPTTVRASTIADPVYGIDRQTGAETAPFQSGSLDVMAIDNLPSELPRDASDFFGRQLLDRIFPELLHTADSAVIRRATIAENGHLTEHYTYLTDYVTQTGVDVTV